VFAVGKVFILDIQESVGDGLLPHGHFDRLTFLFLKFAKDYGGELEKSIS
jgi:hypothetical protein